VRRELGSSLSVSTGNLGKELASPPNWENELNLTTWVAAYKNKKGRARIQRIISTDRNQK